MSSATKSVAAYLDAIARDYPYGVPRAAFVPTTSAAPRAASADQGKQVVFIGEVAGASTESPFSGVEGELLQSAILKGLKMPLAQVSVLPLPLPASSAPLAAQLEQLHPRCIVCMGKKGCEALAEWISSHGQEHVVVTGELSAVVTSIDAKRAFWGDLKRVLVMLSE